MLRDAGYDCGLSGKLHLSTAHVHLPEQRPEDDGFRVFKYSHEPGQRHSSNNYLMWLREKGFDYEELKDKNGYIPTNLHQTKWCTDMAIDYIKEQREYPWFFMINVFDPHGPFDPPQEFINRYDIDILPNPIVSENDYNTNSEIVEQIMFQSRPEKYSERENKKRLVKYFAQIDLIDVQIGRLLKVLKESGQLDNTLIVFMSDHGDMTGDHGLTSKGCRFYESLVKVPLIFWYPAKIKANIQSDALVELTDIVPTLLEITEVEGHERIQGMSLLPILTGRKPADHHRDYVRCEFYDALAVDEDEGIEPSFGTMYRNKKYKLNVYHGIEQGELYDMEKDPNEFNNLWYDKKYKDIKYKLIKKSFDVTVRNIDTGPRRLGRF
jgi:arylsulfatase